MTASKLLVFEFAHVSSLESSIDPNFSIIVPFYSSVSVPTSSGGDCGQGVAHDLDLHVVRLVEGLHF